MHCGGDWLELNWDPCWMRGEIPGGPDTAGGQVKENLMLPSTVSNKDASKRDGLPARASPGPFPASNAPSKTSASLSAKRLSESK